MALTLSLKPGQAVLLWDGCRDGGQDTVRVEFVKYRGGGAVVAITAPKRIKILREELVDEEDGASGDTKE